MRDQVVGVAFVWRHADQERHQAQHAKADNDRPVADRCGDEGRLDHVLAHGKQPLCDRLVPDRVGENRDKEGRTLLQDCLRREEIGLLFGNPGQAFAQDIGAAEAEEHPRNDQDCHCHHRHDLGEVRQNRSPKPGPQGIGQHTDASDQHARLKGQRREDRDERTCRGKVDHQADDAAQKVRNRQNELAAAAVAGLHDFCEGMGVGGEFSKAQTVGIDEQDHQSAPEPVVHGTGKAVVVSRYGRPVEGSRPDPGRRHACGRDAEADLAAGNHVAVDVLVLLVDVSRHEECQTVEQQQQQNDDGRRELKEYRLSHGAAPILCFG